MLDNNSTKFRVGWIDILKCFAIYTVVAGHMMSSGAFASQVGTDIYSLFILTFHMPLFTILSGWFFSAKDNFGAFLKKKSIGILLPYVFWCFIWFFIKPLLEIIFNGRELHLSSIVWQVKFFLYDGLCCYGWWFLRGLFFCFFFAYLSVIIARVYTKNSYALGGTISCILLYFLTLAGIIPNQVEKDSLLKGFIYLYPFFWSGFAIHKAERYFNLALCRQIILSIFAFAVLLLGWQSTYSFYAMNTSAFEPLGNADIVGWKVVYCTLYRYIIGVVGSVMFILLFRKLFNAESNNKFRGFCQNIGKETLGIYILQSLVYWNLPDRDILGWGNVGNFLFSLAVSVMIVVLSFWIIKISAKKSWIGLIWWGKL